jgi:hypothetical protein
VTSSLHDTEHDAGASKKIIVLSYVSFEVFLTHNGPLLLLKLEDALLPVLSISNKVEIFHIISPLL